MPISSQDVIAILTELGIGFENTLYGFCIGTQPNTHESVDRYRIARGGGIAGNSNIWHIECISSGGIAWGRLDTKRKLRQALIEWLAGDRPQERPGYNLYAQRRRNWCGDYEVWVYRRKERIT